MSLFIIKTEISIVIFLFLVEKTEMIIKGR